MRRKFSVQYTAPEKIEIEQPHTPTHKNTHITSLNEEDKPNPAPFMSTSNRRTSRINLMLSPNAQNHKIRNMVKYQEISQNFIITAQSVLKQFLNLVSTSTGREKVLSVFQYIGEYVYPCKEFQHSFNIRNGKKKNVAKCEFDVLDQRKFSQARKTFRLLKFLNYLKSVQKVMQTKKPSVFKLIGCFAHYCSLMYYISDNIIFGMNLFVKRQQFNYQFYCDSVAIVDFHYSKIIPKERELRWKDNKNTFSLLRILLSISRHLWSLLMHHQKEKKLLNLIQQADDTTIQKEQQIHSICEKYLKQCHKRRLEWMDLAMDICRFFMLYNTLKLPAYRIVDSVFIEFCGITSSVMSLMKMIIDKKIFVSMKINEDQDESQIISRKDLSYFLDQLNEKEISSGLTYLDGILGNRYKN